MKFLSYLWNGWEIDFYHDRIEFKNPVNRDLYRVQVDPYSPTPFLIQLIEKG